MKKYYEYFAFEIIQSSGFCGFVISCEFFCMQTFSQSSLERNTNSAWALNENTSHIRNGRSHFAGLGRSWQRDKSGLHLPVALFLTLPVSLGWSLCSSPLLSLCILVLSFFFHPSVLSYILPPDLVTFKSFVMSCGGVGKAKRDALLIPAMEL